MTEAPGAPATIRVEVVCAWPDRVWQRSLCLPAGATVADALRTVDWRDIEAAVGTPPKVGIYGRLVAETERLSDGDRIELYRPLLADPREARRRRAAAGRG